MDEATEGFAKLLSTQSLLDDLGQIASRALHAQDWARRTFDPVRSVTAVHLVAPRRYLVARLGQVMRELGVERLTSTGSFWRACNALYALATGRNPDEDRAGLKRYVEYAVPKLNEIAELTRAAQAGGDTMQARLVSVFCRSGFLPARKSSCGNMMRVARAGFQPVSPTGPRNSSEGLWETTRRAAVRSLPYVLREDRRLPPSETAAGRPGNCCGRNPGFWHPALIGPESSGTRGGSYGDFWTGLLSATERPYGPQERSRPCRIRLLLNWRR
jgi:hypothetical protein